MYIPAGHGLIAFQFSGAAVPLGAACTVGFDNNGSRTAAEAAEDAGTIFADTLLVGLTDDVTFVNCHVKLGPNDTGAAGDFAFAVDGSGSENSATPNVAYLLRKVTASGGRRNRGRMFLPGVAETAVNNSGVINAGALTDQQGRADSFFDDMAAADMPLELFHTETLAPTLLTSLAFDPRVATQRRRLRR